jgi:hypothetical protein
MSSPGHEEPHDVHRPARRIRGRARPTVGNRSESFGLTPLGLPQCRGNLTAEGSNPKEDK